MDKNFYKNIINININKMMELSKIIEDIDHSSVIGNFRELFLSELIKPYLSPQMEIATGKIIDLKGNESKQIDTIIYDSSIIPPALIIQGQTVIPVEAVLATIEVKSTLKSDDLKNAIENGLSVKNLDIHESVKSGTILNGIPSYIFAYNEIKKTERDRVIEKIKQVSKDKNGDKIYAPISGVCVTNRDYVFFRNNNRIPQGYGNKTWHYETLESSWKVIERKSDSYENILHFMIDLIESIHNIRKQRQRINFGLYLLNEN
jgi:uncharacterized protein (UPF0297 family)